MLLRKREMARKVFSSAIVVAVLGDLAMGYTVLEVHRRYKVPVVTVRRWAKKARIDDRHVSVAAKESIGALVDDYLRKALKALGAQAEFASGSEYLTSQSAADLAALHNALAGQAIRVLSALREDIPVPEPPALEPAVQ